MRKKGRVKWKRNGMGGGEARGDEEKKEWSGVMEGRGSYRGGRTVRSS